jgi:hypothetical protein
VNIEMPVVLASHQMSGQGKLMKRFGLLAILCLISTPAFLANDMLDFKGFPLNGRVEAFKQKFPSFQCKQVMDDLITCDSYRETYAGYDADIILVSFPNGKLQSFRIDGTGLEKQSKILLAMKEKYGEPSSEDKQSVYWKLANGNCRLLSGPPPQFQVICVSNAGPPKSDKPAKNDI